MERQDVQKSLFEAVTFELRPEEGCKGKQRRGLGGGVGETFSRQREQWNKIL